MGGTVATKIVESNHSRLKLLKDWLVEIHLPGQYFRRMKRSEVAKLFKVAGSWLNVAFQGAAWREDSDDYYPNKFFDTSTEAVAGKTRVTIGCTTFTGPNVEILRKWALGKARHA